MPADLQVRNGMLLYPANEFEQGRQVRSGLQAACHLSAEIGIHHPRRNSLPDLGITEIQVFDASAAKFTHDTEVMLTKEMVKWIPNINLALVSGIIACRL
jgi:hypothetical protein